MITQCWYYRIPHSCFSTTLKTIAHFCAAQKQKTCDWRTCTLAARWTCWVVSWRSLNTATTLHDATCNRRKKGKSEVQWVVCATEWPARPVLLSHWCCYTLDLCSCCSIFQHNRSYTARLCTENGSNHRAYLSERLPHHTNENVSIVKKRSLRILRAATARKQL